MQNLFMFQMFLLQFISVLASKVLLYDSKLEQMETIGIDSSEILTTVDEKFLSFAIDSHVIAERWKNFDFESPRVQNMAKALSPAYIRLGGTAADLLTFEEKPDFFMQPDFSDPKMEFGETNCWCATKKNGIPICEDLDKLYKRGNFTMTGLDWIRLNEFSRKSGWEVLFDFNVLKRSKDGESWDSSNAKKLLDFSSKLGYSNVAFELGNEPNSLFHQLHFNMTAEMLGRSFQSLKRLLGKYPQYKKSLLVGPDLNQVRKCWQKRPKYCKALQYLGEFLDNSHGVLDALTWHHYYLDGHTATLQDFLNPDVLDDFQLQMHCVQEYLTTIKKVDYPLWLGETSSAYGGGAKGISDRYVAGFLWLDKLGLAAVNNYQVVIRQSFYHGCYALIGEDLYPNPDFWISRLHKTLVGTKVLKILRKHPPISGQDSTLRVYAHCTKDRPGSVTLFGINLSEEVKTFRLGSPLREAKKIEHYVLSPTNGNLLERGIKLNGQQLLIIKQKYLPKIRPKVTKGSPLLALKPFEMAFWVFPKVNINLCF